MVIDGLARRSRRDGYSPFHFFDLQHSDTMSLSAFLIHIHCTRIVIEIVAIALLSLFASLLLFTLWRIIQFIPRVVRYAYCIGQTIIWFIQYIFVVCLVGALTSIALVLIILEFVFLTVVNLTFGFPIII